MERVAQVVEFRPLSIGEIFDRAVTLTVRNWLPFTLAGAVAVLPSHICMYLSTTLGAYWMAAFYLFSLLTLTGTLASARIVAQIYRGETVDWRASLRFGVWKLAPSIGAILTMGLIALLPLIIVVGIPAGLGVFRFSNPLADCIALVAGVCGLAIYVAMNFAGYYALNAMAIDDCRAMDAVGRGLALFAQPHAARTMLVATAQVAITAGGAFVAGALGQLLVPVVHSAAAATAIGTLIVFLTTVYGNVVVPVFYFDFAIRTEGHDLQAALDAMPTA